MYRPAPLLLLACLLGATLPATALEPFTAVYDISRGILTVGEMTRRLSVDEHARYAFESSMRARGLVSLFADTEVVETSHGRVEGNRLRPERYRYDKNGARKDYELQFDYGSNTVRRSDPGQDWSATMPPDLQDKLSYQAQMMGDLRSGPESLDYAIADRDRLKQYAIAVLGSEDIETGIGRFAAVKLERAKPGSKRRTIVWCARALDWMPVKVEYHDKKGGITTAVLKSLERQGAAGGHAAAVTRR